MRVVFACAGTGGHINPAIAMANLILKKENDSQILFIGTETGLENKLVENAGYKISHIRTGKILRELTLKNITALINAYKGIGDAKTILKEFKPDIVIGTGGYICGPVMKAAKKLKIPYYLHESNAFPGVSVKLLAKDAKCVMVGFEDTKARLNSKAKVVYTGTPAKFTEEDILKAKEYIDSGIEAIEAEQDTGIIYKFGQELSKLPLSTQEYKENVQKVTKEEIIKFANLIQINTIYFLRNGGQNADN